LRYCAIAYSTNSLKKPQQSGAIADRREKVALYCYSHSRGERFHHGLTFMTFDFGWFGKVAGGGCSALGFTSFSSSIQGACQQVIGEVA
jgi:hypothetical protein